MKVFINDVSYIPAPPLLDSDAPILERVLSCPINYELGNKTIRDYLYDLLKTLWDEGEGFSGQCPFGNSGWAYDMAYALAKQGIVEAEIYEDGYVVSFSSEEKQKAYSLIKEAIAFVFYGSSPQTD